MGIGNERQRITYQHLEEMEYIRSQEDIKKRQLLIQEKAQQYGFEKDKMEIERLANLDRYHYNAEIEKIQASIRKNDQYHQRETAKINNDFINNQTALSNEKFKLSNIHEENLIKEKNRNENVLTRMKLDFQIENYKCKNEQTDILLKRENEHERNRLNFQFNMHKENLNFQKNVMEQDTIRIRDNKIHEENMKAINNSFISGMNKINKNFIIQQKKINKDIDIATKKNETDKLNIQSNLEKFKLEIQKDINTQNVKSQERLNLAEMNMKKTLNEAQQNHEIQIKKLKAEEDYRYRELENEFILKKHEIDEKSKVEMEKIDSEKLSQKNEQERKILSMKQEHEKYMKDKEEQLKDKELLRQNLSFAFRLQALKSCGLINQKEGDNSFINTTLFQMLNPNNMNNTNNMNLFSMMNMMNNEEVKNK